MGTRVLTTYRSPSSLVHPMILTQVYTWKYDGTLCLETQGRWHCFLQQLPLGWPWNLEAVIAGRSVCSPWQLSGEYPWKDRILVAAPSVFLLFWKTDLDTTMMALTGIAWNCGTAAFWAPNILTHMTTPQCFPPFWCLKKNQGSGTVAMMSLSDASCSVSTQRNRLDLRNCSNLHVAVSWNADGSNVCWVTGYYETASVVLILFSLANRTLNAVVGVCAKYSILTKSGS